MGDKMHSSAHQTRSPIQLLHHLSSGTGWWWTKRDSRQWFPWKYNRLSLHRRWRRLSDRPQVQAPRRILKDKSPSALLIDTTESGLLTQRRHTKTDDQKDKERWIITGKLWFGLFSIVEILVNLVWFVEKIRQLPSRILKVHLLELEKSSDEFVCLTCGWCTRRTYWWWQRTLCTGRVAQQRRSTADWRRWRCGIFHYDDFSHCFLYFGWVHRGSWRLKWLFWVFYARFKPDEGVKNYFKIKTKGLFLLWWRMFVYFNCRQSEFDSHRLHTDVENDTSVVYKQKIKNWKIRSKV